VVARKGLGIRQDAVGVRQDEGRPTRSAVGDQGDGGLDQVKPMFELRLAHLPAEPGQRAKAVEMAVAAFESAGWRAPQAVQSPLRGRRGAIEYLIHLRRAHP